MRLLAVFKNLLLMLLSFCLALIVAEFLVRVFLPQRLTYQRENRYTVVENFLNWSGQNTTREFNVRLEFNGRGMRGPERPYTKRPGNRRILFLGDSFVEGAQVNWDQHFASMIQQELDQWSPHHYEVISYGVAGWEPIQELILLQNEAYKYQPDCLYLFIFPENDIGGGYTRYYAEGLRRFENRYDLNLLYRAQESSGIFLQMKEYLLTHSHLFTLFKVFLETTHLKDNLKGLQRALKMINIPEREDNISEQNEKFIRAWDVFRRVIRRFHDYCDKHNIEIKVVMVPFITQINPTSHSQKHQKVMTYDWGCPDGYEKASRIVEEEGIEVIDLLPFMLKAKSSQPTFKEDIHWTPAGHRIVANVILEDIFHNE